MAKIETKLYGNFDTILYALDETITGRSISAKLEDRSDFFAGTSRCAVRVYERYSYLGKNRVSLSITLLQSNDDIYLSAITSGGSQALFFKINTIGEHSFLETIRSTIDRFRNDYR